MRRWLVAMGALTLSLPNLAWGADAQVSLGTVAEYDDNVFREDRSRNDDLVFRINPRLHLIEDEGSAQWNLTYWFPWERGVFENRVKGFRHFLNGSGSVQLSERTRLFANDRFSHTDNLNAGLRLEDEDGDGGGELNTFRNTVLRNRASLGVQHSFTQRTSGTLRLSNNIFDSNIPNRSDTMAHAANLSLNHVLRPRHQVGAGIEATYHDFDPSNDGLRESRSSLFVNWFAAWTWLIDEITTLEVSGGPTFIDNMQRSAPAVLTGQDLIPSTTDSEGTLFVGNFDLCGSLGGMLILELCRDVTPVTDPADVAEVEAGQGTETLTLVGPGTRGSRTAWTFFGRTSLSRRWTPTTASTLLYQRTDSTSSGVGGSTVLDLVSLLFTWNLSELWRFDARGDFAHRSSTASSRVVVTEVMLQTLGSGVRAAAVTGDRFALLLNQEVDSNRYGASARLQRRFTRHLFGTIRYSFNMQESQGIIANDFMNHVVAIGVEYRFDRWKLW